MTTNTTTVVEQGVTVAVVAEGYDDATFNTLARNPVTPTHAFSRKAGKAPAEHFFWAWNPALWRWFCVAEADLSSCGYTFRQRSIEVSK